MMRVAANPPMIARPITFGSNAALASSTNPLPMSEARPGMFSMNARPKPSTNRAATSTAAAATAARAVTNFGFVTIEPMAKPIVSTTCSAPLPTSTRFALVNSPRKNSRIRSPTGFRAGMILSASDAKAATIPPIGPATANPAIPAPAAATSLDPPTASEIDLPMSPTLPASVCRRGSASETNSTTTSFAVLNAPTMVRPNDARTGRTRSWANETNVRRVGSSLLVMKS